MFKLIGFVTGYLLGGFWGAIAGLFAGVVIDRVRAYPGMYLMLKSSEPTGN